MMNLGARLKAAAGFVEAGCRVADIGTDHAYLPIYLLEKKMAVYAYACDVNQGPFNAAAKAVRRSGLTDFIDVRLGDGLKALEPGEADNVVIAGMGGSTMIEIMQAAPQVATAVQRFIFQPMNDAARLRGWLLANGWQIIDETLVEDEGRLYELICAEPGSMELGDDILLEIGPILWEKKPTLLRSHLQQLLDKSGRIIKGMQESEQARHSTRYELECKRYNELEARLKCL